MDLSNFFELNEPINVFGLNPNETFQEGQIPLFLRSLPPTITCAQVPERTGYIAVSELICGRLKLSEPGTESKLTGQTQCSPLGFRIANSLIRIASTRIFAVPEQSILELPVNSIDSYVDEMKRLGIIEYGQISNIGKFGLGFFSFLYWLVGHPQRYLHLESTFEEHNGNLCSWEIIIVQYSGYLIWQFAKTPVKSQTGTKITVHAEKDPLNVNQFMNQVQKLKYVNVVDITVNSQIINPTEKICGEVCPVINIIISPTFIQNTDFATGISLRTLFGSLLVPSISTKQIRDVILNPSANIGTSIKENNTNIFSLLVGNIAVVILPFTHVYSQKYEVILQMKGGTPLPVSRDDILWGRPGVSEEFLTNLIRLREIILSTNISLLYILKYALNAYINYQSAAKNLINNFWNQTQQLVEGNNIYYVPLEYLHFFHKLNNQRFIGMDESVNIALEQYLEKNFQWDTNVYFGKYLMILPNLIERVSTGGTNKFLFVDENFTKTYIEWIADISTSLPAEYLLPVSMDLGKESSRKINIMLQEISPQIYLETYNLILRINGLITYFNVENLNDMLFNVISGIKYVQNINIQLTKDLIAITQKYLHDTIPKVYSYGSDRSRLFIHISSIPQIPQPNKYTEKVISYIRDYYHFTYDVFSREGFHVIKQFLPVVIKPDYLEQNPIFHFSKNINEYLALTFFDIPNDISDILTEYEVNMLLDFWRTNLDNYVNRDILFIYASTRYKKDEFISRINVSLSEVLRTIRMKQTISTVKITDSPTQYRFTLSNLIDYTFNDPTLSFDNFLQKIPQITAWKPHQFSGFQAIEIAINETTTKPFIQAVMIETCQNSLDAMKLEGIQGVVNIKTKTVESQSIELIISDPVGIGSNGLLALSIPFLSTKTPSEIVTGEMGSGFFNLYRESDLVRISTVKNGISVLIEDIPIRRAGRAVDVNRSMNIGVSDQHNGTTISVIFTPQNFYQALAEISNIGQHVLSLNGAINFNGKFYNIPREPLLTSDTFEAFTISDLEVSWILTKDVPFRGFTEYFNFTDILPSYLNNKVVTGLLFNVKHGGYTPVQSRTKIIIPENLKTELRNFLLDTVYLRVLQKYLPIDSWEQDKYIPNSTSSGSINQVKFNLTPNWQTLSEFLLNYNYKDGPSLIEIFNNISQFIGERKPSTIEKEIRQYLNTKLSNSIIVDAVWKWLSDKSGVLDLKSITILDIKLKDSVTIITRFTQVFVNTFWQIGTLLNIPETNFKDDSPRCFWVFFNMNVTGQYLVSFHMIELGLKNFDTTVNKILQKIESGLNAETLLSLFQTFEVQRLLGVSYPASTLIHELAHAWRRTSDSELHEPINLTINETTKLYTFEEAANVVFQEILKRGFIDRFITAWNSS